MHTSTECTYLIEIFISSSNSGKRCLDLRYCKSAVYDKNEYLRTQYVSSRRTSNFNPNQSKSYSSFAHIVHCTIWCSNWNWWCMNLASEHDLKNMSQKQKKKLNATFYRPPERYAACKVVEVVKFTRNMFTSTHYTQQE